MIIYVDAPLADVHKQRLVKHAAGDEFIFKDEIKDDQQRLEKLLEADVVFGNPKPPEWLEKASDLKWIQFPSAGFELYKNIKTNAITTNMQDYYSEPCAETIVAGILALCRGMDDFTLLKDQKKWLGNKARPGLWLLKNKRVFILGAGNIGKRVAKLLGGFDCEIFFYGRKETINTPADLEILLPAADIVVGCLPGTIETKGLFTKKMIERLHNKAIFCNVGRGNLLEDESALIEALMTGRIGGAVLDVTASEPIPADHPLWNCPNTILSQHSGGGSDEEFDGIIDFFLENLENFKKDRPLRNQVQLSKGY
jgi:phosphoglycerate dehydrogenase-like enzyme